MEPHDKNTDKNTEFYGHNSQYKEYLHFNDVIDSLKYYDTFISANAHLKLQKIDFLLPHYQKLLSQFRRNITSCGALANLNQTFLNKVASNAYQNFRGDLHQQFGTKKFFADRKDKVPKEHNIDKVLSTLKQCARDWSSEGVSERGQCYGVVLRELEKLFPDFDKRSQVKVLNPGCGLSRMTWEICKRGFFSQGNEFSYFMLFTSHLILNHSTKDKYRVHPYLHLFNNNYSFANHSRSVTFPDVDPNDLPKQGLFSMVAGDFVEVYSNPKEVGCWDVLVSVFFMDTAHNILQYLELISRLLKPGGFFLNFGPLLFHYENSSSEFSVEPDYETIKGCLPAFGLDLIKEETHLSSGYCRDNKSMLQSEYKCFLWVCRKSEKPTELSKNPSFFDEEGHFTQKMRMGGLKEVPRFLR